MKPTTPIIFRVQLTKQAERDLEEIKERRTFEAIEAEIKALAVEPDQARRAMSAEYKGYFRVRAAGQRYRVVYAVQREKARVLVVLIGIRREGDPSDVYEKGKKRLRLYQDSRLEADPTPPKAARERKPRKK